ncbi:helix-turn-helix domain-containing protein [Paenibacillus sp. P26]|nr:helix-turn-helix domain-containing protein [Paenibacillus sp. P26]UUZ97014.1 helix-turn-helix domain-containing protein [Paenibacillus sp. P25]
MSEPTGYFRYHASRMLADILGLLADDFLGQSRLDTTFPSSYLTFRKLVDHLNNFFETELSREVLESALDRRYVYLCQVFKKYAGTTINHYIHQLRRQRAKHLLLHTGKSVKEIAEEVGYRDPYFFSRMFKRIEGKAPQHFRENPR